MMLILYVTLLNTVRRNLHDQHLGNLIRNSIVDRNMCVDSLINRDNIM